MRIGWFPGHMNKTRRLLKERIRRCDLVVEVLDARLPASSMNPMLRQIRGNVPCLRVLTKPDLADPHITGLWLKHLAKSSTRTLALEATERKNVKRLVEACKAIALKRGKGMLPTRVMIAGIPNVGKSTLFNLLAGKKKAEVRNKPAVTRMEQMIDTQYGLSLVDTPGVLWPKLEDQEGAYRLAASGAVGIAAHDPVEVARFTLRYLISKYPDALAGRFGASLSTESADDALLGICEARGLLLKGGGPDRTKGAELLLKELRTGRLGRVSLEEPPTGSSEPLPLTPRGTSSPHQR